METQSLYPDEYQIAKEVIDMINEKAGICLPEGRSVLSPCIFIQP